MEDAEIIRQILDGEHQQYSLLVQRYQAPLIHFLRGMLRDDSEVFDCAQEAFITAYQNLWRYSNKYSFRAWLYRIARNKALDRLRRQRYELPLPVEENRPASVTGPEKEWLAKEEAARVRAALNVLPEHYRQALYLRYYQELSYEEIAQVLNIPLSRVKTYLHRGKAKLRAELERKAVADGQQRVKTVFSGPTP